jgi:5-methylcytosine-specific restriction endonuclease McrA
VTRGRRQSRKHKLVELAGGRCVECGYNRCVGALTFHHLVSAKKRFPISMAYGWSMDKVKRELKKCALLCSNCHHEIHAGLRKLKVS